VDAALTPPHDLLERRFVAGLGLPNQLLDGLIIRTSVGQAGLALWVRLWDARSE
jgi:hypothetical protein